MRELLFFLIFVLAAALGTIGSVVLRKRLGKNLEKRDLETSAEEKSALEIFESEGRLTEFRQAEVPPDAGEDEDRFPSGEDLVRELETLPPDLQEEILKEAGLWELSEPEDEDGREEREPV